jgi:hypothetical protein
MKEYEELARMRVNDAIQTGLRSQSIHRALSEDTQLTPSVSLKKAGHLNPEPSSLSDWFTLLFSRFRNSPSNGD